MDLPRGLVLVLLLTSSLVTSWAVTPRPCGDREVVVVRGGRRQSDGSVVAEDGNSFPPGCYWESANNLMSGCPGKLNPCLWKCCPDNQAIGPNHQCHDSGARLLNTYRAPPRGSFNISSFSLIHGDPCLHKSSMFDDEEGYRFVVNDNGSLFVDHPDDDSEDALVPSGGFCSEVLEFNRSARVAYYECFVGGDDETVVDNGKLKLKFLLNSIAALVSVPFLVATLVVYSVVPELRNLHGKCLMCHVASLAVAFVSMALIQLGIDLLSTGGCIAAALIAYLFILASFLWLNVMCFDIWWTFSGYRGRIGSKDPRDRKKFVYYSLYAWGAAVVFLCVCATMQFMEDLPETILRPHFGDTTCWFNDNATKWAYFNGPIAALIVCNLMFFTLTALSLCKIKKQTAVLNEGKESQRNSHRDIHELRFKLYLKLFVVMGVPWTMEIISSAVGGHDAIWWIPDLANFLVGILIFIIFVWKSKVRQLFLAKLNTRMGSSGASTSAYELT